MQYKLYVQNSFSTAYPRNMDCFGYIIVNTLHTSDNKDNSGDDDGGGDYDDDDNNNNNQT